VRSDLYFIPFQAFQSIRNRNLQSWKDSQLTIVLSLPSYRTPTLLFVDWRSYPSPGQSNAAPRPGACHGINAIHDARDMHDGSHGDSVKL
jgi:hypothetical protein